MSNDTKIINFDDAVICSELKRLGLPSLASDWYAACTGRQSEEVKVGQAETKQQQKILPLRDLRGTKEFQS